MLWSNGKVRPVGGAPFYGDTRRDGINNVVGMLASNDAGGGGYWLMTSAGGVFSFGPTCGTDSQIVGPSHVPTSGVVSLVGRSDGYAGFEMVTACGKMYGFECEFNS